MSAFANCGCEPVGVAQMDTSIIAALAALAGAAIGGLTSFVSSRAQAKAQWLAQIQLRRQELYKEFIGDASRLFIHALQNDADKADVFALMALYAEVSRMRPFDNQRCRQRRPNR